MIVLPLTAHELIVQVTEALETSIERLKTGDKTERLQTVPTSPDSSDEDTDAE